MDKHLSPAQMKSFYARTLTSAEMGTAIEHLTHCPNCRQRYHEVFQEMNDHQPAFIDLSPEFQFRQEHLDFEQLVSLAENKFDEEEKEIITLHVQNCSRCSEDVRSFLAFRHEIEPEMSVSYAPVHEKVGFKQLAQRWNWRSFGWKPLYAGMIAGAFILTLLTVFFWWDASRKDFLQTNVSSPSPQASEKGRSVESQSPTPAFSPSPHTEISEEVIVSLRDNTRDVAMTRTGKIKGLEDVPAELQDSIKQALLTQTLKKPQQLHPVSGEAGSQRGSPENKSDFRLLSPVATTITDDRPVFRWQPIAGASSYEVQVGDARGDEVADSKSLASTINEWRPSQPLRRGVIYSWTVTATVNGQSITAPAPTSPEAKFRILEAAKLHELEMIKKRTRSHLALAIFYAREGMLAEAERELQQLAKENPQSPVPAKLLRAVRSWR